jgi:hypothetical protein
MDEIEPTTTRAPRRRGESPKAPEPEAGDVLIYNDRGGFLQAYYTTPGLEVIQGRQQLNVVTVRMGPGLSFANAADWAKVAANGNVKRRIAAGEVEAIADFGSLRLKRAVDMVEKTANVEALKRLLDDETRPQVAEAIELQIAKCIDEGADQRAARAHHRRQNRPRTRLR